MDAALALPVYEMRLQVHHLVATAMDPLVPTKEPKEPITVTPKRSSITGVSVSWNTRVETNVSEACRTFGVSRTTFYRWQRRVETGGLEALMPKGRRPPAMPNQTPAWVVDELLAEAVVRPTLGARRYADDLGQRGFVISASGVQKILGRHGLGRRRQRVAALAQLTAATTGLVSDDAREGPFGFCHFAARPGDLVALDSFYIGNLKGVGPVWQLTAVDTATRWAICRSVPRPVEHRHRETVPRPGDPQAPSPRRDRHRSAHRQRSRVQRPLRHHLESSRSPITGPRPGPRTTTRSANDSKAPRSQECWRPAFHRRRFDRLGQLRAEINTWLVDYNTRRPNHSDFMRGRTPRQVLDTHRRSEHHDHDQQGPSVTSTRGPEALGHGRHERGRLVDCFVNVRSAFASARLIGQIWRAAIWPFGSRDGRGRPRSR